jgi:TetR/AcrR family transcriptional repressor of nem operon
MARPRGFDEDTVLDRAVDTFWEHGFDATAMQHLCAAMGLNSGSVYGAFGDKRALFLKALDRYVDTVSRQAVDRLSGGATGLAGIRTYFEYLVDTILDGKRRWGCLITNTVSELAQRDGEVATRVALHFARVETAFQGALVRARADGELRAGVGPQHAVFLMCVLQGLNVLARTAPRREALETIVDTALAAVAKT